MLKNEQAPEKQVRSGSTLAVNSVFHTIQGEGPFAGEPAIFIRLAGCNLQCPRCDTEYTNRTPMSVHDVMVAVEKAKIPGYMLPDLVVITGGEPFRQPINNLVCDLLMFFKNVQIETNGTLHQPLDAFGDRDLTIVCSPKAGAINRKLAPYINAYKYVASVDSLLGSGDGLPTHALEHPNGKGLARPPHDFKGLIYLQPVDEQDAAANAANQKAVVASCMQNGYRLCLQMHKIVGVD